MNAVGHVVRFVQVIDQMQGIDSLVLVQITYRLAMSSSFRSRHMVLAFGCQSAPTRGQPTVLPQPGHCRVTTESKRPPDGLMYDKMSHRAEWVSVGGRDRNASLLLARTDNQAIAARVVAGDRRKLRPSKRIGSVPSLLWKCSGEDAVLNGRDGTLESAWPGANALPTRRSHSQSPNGSRLG